MRIHRALPLAARGERFEDQGYPDLGGHQSMELKGATTYSLARACESRLKGWDSPLRMYPRNPCGNDGTKRNKRGNKRRIDERERR